VALQGLFEICAEYLGDIEILEGKPRHQVGRGLVWTPYGVTSREYQRMANGD
jgi:hypothetical protein